MERLDTKGILLRIFAPTSVFSLAYLITGYFSRVPLLLLFCILGTVILVPMELGIILRASKKEYGTYSLKSAFSGQNRLPFWRVLVTALALFAVAGLLSAFIAPLENQIFSAARAFLLGKLPAGFDWTDYARIKAFPKPILILTCVYYCFFNVLLGPVTEELFFRGYLTSHWERQSRYTPILITVLFSLYHFWLPFNNIFRILAFAPAAYMAYREKNLYISIFFHCFCNLFSSVGFALAVLR